MDGLDMFSALGFLLFCALENNEFRSVLDFR